MKKHKKRIKKRIRKKIAGLLKNLLRLFLLFGPVILMLAPVFFLLSGSITSQQELHVILQEKNYEEWNLFSRYPTLEHYQKVLLYSPPFFVVFWNSVKMTLLILAGQLLVGTPAAWAFAVFSTRRNRQNPLFLLYIILMLLPFQVTMLSQYLVLNGIGLMDTEYAVILPAVFSTFPVFLLYRSFCEIPKTLLEAARMDGAGEIQLFGRIGLPLASGGISSCLVLGFLECWNMIEQPLAFLRDRSKWPLSLYLPAIDASGAGFSFAASVIVLIPAVFVFLLGQEQLERGIVASGLKE